MATNPLRDTVFMGNQRAYDIFGTVCMISSSVLSLGAGALSSGLAAVNAGTSVVQALGVYGAKTVVTFGAAAGGGVAGREIALGLGASETVADITGLLSGTAVGMAAGFGANAVDKHFNLSGYHVSPSSLTPEQAQQQKTIADVENGDTPLNNNQQKGNYGEMKMDQFFEEQGYQRVSDGRVTDLNSPTQRGLDGVYYNEGPPPHYIVAEAKYNTSQLGMTQDGLQMSDTWIIGRNRLLNAVGPQTLDALYEIGYIKYLVQVMPDGSVISTILP